MNNDAKQFGQTMHIGLTVLVGGMVAWSFFDSQKGLATIDERVTATQLTVGEVKSDVKGISANMSSHLGPPHSEQLIHNKTFDRRLGLLESQIGEVVNELGELRRQMLKGRP